ncbi:MAG: DNA-processing protein DprA [Spirochaetales bacterium]|uniref:DNA-processing protein DprA n=1 Tax=Candidatus Thalassospirochaeta sargassi TaxID=3119039 RepID=A0AAJ1IFV9_9SPIO|nr:DNA-processing protein DprA [Spirochaetales bacterium]
MADLLNLIISRCRFLELEEKLLLRDVCGSSDAFSLLVKEDLEMIIGRKLRIDENTVKKTVFEAVSAHKILAAGHIKCLFFGEQDYPRLLSEIYNPPFALFCRGDVPDWSIPSAGVVGTRLASGSGLDAAYRLGVDFAEAGVAVISGLAMGIDSAAHSGCCDAGGKTIAVLGCGVDRIYPAVNRKLAARILKGGGAIVSEYLPGEEPRKHHFPERNRLISGLSYAVAVVDAPGKSGALITADFALDQGRELFIHSAGLKAEGDRGRLEKMVFDGAPVIDNALPVLNELGVSKAEKPRPDKTRDLTSGMAGRMMAEMLSDELEGRSIKFNGNYIRRACYESSYSINS